MGIRCVLLPINCSLWCNGRRTATAETPPRPPPFSLKLTEKAGDGWMLVLDSVWELDGGERKNKRERERSSFGVSLPVAKREQQNKHRPQIRFPKTSHSLSFYTPPRPAHQNRLGAVKSAGHSELASAPERFGKEGKKGRKKKKKRSLPPSNEI